MDSSSNEDSDFFVEGVDPNDGKWVIANRNKKNRKRNDRTPVQTMDKIKETEKDGDRVYVANPVITKPQMLRIDARGPRIRHVGSLYLTVRLQLDANVVEIGSI